MLKKFFALIYIFTSLVLGNGAIPTAISKIFLVTAAVPYIMPGSKTFSVLKPYFLWCMSFVILCWLSLYWAYDRATGMNLVTTVTFVYICNIALSALIINSNKPVIYWLKIFMYFYILIRILYIFKHGITYGYDVSRSNSDINANTIGMVSGISCSLAIYFYKFDTKLKKKYLMLILAGLFMFVILITASKKAFLFPFAIYSIFKLISGKDKQLIFNIIVIFIVSALALWAILNIPALYEMIGYRIDSMLNGFFGDEEDMDGSTHTRMILIELGMMVFPDRPLLGHGVCNFIAIYHSYFPEKYAVYAHNNYIELMVDLGVVGLVLYYIFYLYLIIKLYILAKRDNDSMAMLLLSVVVTLVFIHYGFVAFYSPFNNIVLTIATCYALVKSNISKQLLWELKRKKY